MRRIWVLTSVGLALAGTAGFVLWGPTGGSAADVSYRLAPLERGAITASVRATGTLNPVTTVLVGSQMSGQVVEILADYNSPVKAGQVVARLYAEQIKARRDAARADLEGARADLAMRRAQLERSRATRQRAEASLQDQLAQRDRVTAQFGEAKRALDRQTELTARNVGSQTALESARTQADVQKAGLASSQAQIASQHAELTGLAADIVLAEAQVKSAEAVIQQREAKLRDIEIDLHRTEIRSPVDGVVVQRQVDLGQTVAASLNAPTLFTVAQDLRQIDVHANIDEADVGRIRPSQPVTFTVNAYPNRTFSGTVRMVRLSAQTVQNVVTYTTVIGVENRDLTLLPGMTANLQIVTDERQDVLRVPNAALRFRPTGSAATPDMPAAAAEESSRPRGERPMRALRERMAAELQPTPEQAAAIDRIMAEGRENSPGREPGLSDEERRAAMRRSRQDLMRAVAAVLDPERRAKFEAMAAEMRGRTPPQAEAGMPGRVHMLDPEGKPKPIGLRLGVSDGSYTEVLAGELTEGAGVIVGGPRAPSGGSTQEASPAGRPRGPRLF